jgi:hypothetical protein
MISPDLSLIISCMNANDLFVNNSNRYVLDGVNILLMSFPIYIGKAIVIHHLYTNIFINRLLSCSTTQH